MLPRGPKEWHCGFLWRSERQGEVAVACAPKFPRGCPTVGEGKALQDRRLGPGTVVAWAVVLVEVAAVVRYAEESQQEWSQAQVWG